MAQFCTEIKKELQLFSIDFHELILCSWRLFWISFYIRYPVFFFFFYLKRDGLVHMKITIGRLHVLHYRINETKWLWKTMLLQSDSPLKVKHMHMVEFYLKEVR